MCGICGKVSVNGVVSEDLIRKMCGALTHRGPDDEGVWVLDSAKYSSSEVEKHILPRSNNIGAGVRSNGIGRVSAGLGHRRLAIIDLSEAGHQPMSNEDGSIWIVLNGEIYNFVEMSDNCVNRGYFKKEAIKKLLDEHVAARANNGARIWSLLFLELWYREFIDSY